MCRERIWGSPREISLYISGKTLTLPYQFLPLVLWKKILVLIETHYLHSTHANFHCLSATQYILHYFLCHIELLLQHLLATGMMMNYVSSWWRRGTAKGCVLAVGSGGLLNLSVPLPFTDSYTVQGVNRTYPPHQSLSSIQTDNGGTFTSIILWF